MPVVLNVSRNLIQSPNASSDPCMPVLLIRLVTPCDVVDGRCDPHLSQKKCRHPASQPGLRIL